MQNGFVESFSGRLRDECLNEHVPDPAPGPPSDRGLAPLSADCLAIACRATDDYTTTDPTRASTASPHGNTVNGPWKAKTRTERLINADHKGSRSFDLIVVVLGLFALSQAFFLLIAPDESPEAEPVSGKITAGFKELSGHKRVATGSAGFGVILGMISGTGEFTAQFVSYTYARKTSKTPELFGKGAPEGLIA